MASIRIFEFRIRQIRSGLVALSLFLLVSALFCLIHSQNTFAGMRGSSSTRNVQDLINEAREAVSQNEREIQGLVNAIAIREGQLTTLAESKKDEERQFSTRKRLFGNKNVRAKEQEKLARLRGVQGAEEEIRRTNENSKRKLKEAREEKLKLIHDRELLHGLSKTHAGEEISMSRLKSDSLKRGWPRSETGRPAGPVPLLSPLHENATQCRSYLSPTQGSGYYFKNSGATLPLDAAERTEMNGILSRIDSPAPDDPEGAASHRQLARLKDQVRLALALDDPRHPNQTDWAITTMGRAAMEVSRSLYHKDPDHGKVSAFLSYSECLKNAVERNIPAHRMPARVPADAGHSSMHSSEDSESVCELDGRPPFRGLESHMKDSSVVLEEFADSEEFEDSEEGGGHSLSKLSPELAKKLRQNLVQLGQILGSDPAFKERYGTFIDSFLHNPALQVPMLRLELGNPVFREALKNHKNAEPILKLLYSVVPHLDRLQPPGSRPWHAHRDNPQINSLANEWEQLHKKLGNPEVGREEREAARARMSKIESQIRVHMESPSKGSPVVAAVPDKSGGSTVGVTSTTWEAHRNNPNVKPLADAWDRLNARLNNPEVNDEQKKSARAKMEKIEQQIRNHIEPPAKTGGVAVADAKGVVQTGMGIGMSAEHSDPMVQNLHSQWRALADQAVRTQDQNKKRELALQMSTLREKIETRMQSLEATKAHLALNREKRVNNTTGGDAKPTVPSTTVPGVANPAQPSNSRDLHEQLFQEILKNNNLQKGTKEHDASRDRITELRRQIAAAKASIPNSGSSSTEVFSIDITKPPGKMTLKEVSEQRDLLDELKTKRKPEYDKNKSLYEARETALKKRQEELVAPPKKMPQTEEDRKLADLKEERRKILEQFGHNDFSNGHNDFSNKERAKEIKREIDAIETKKKSEEEKKNSHIGPAI